MWEAPTWYRCDDCKAKIKKKKSTAKTGIFHRVDTLLEMSEIHLFLEGAPHKSFLLSSNLAKG